MPRSSQDKARRGDYGNQRQKLASEVVFAFIYLIAVFIFLLLACERRWSGEPKRPWRGICTAHNRYYGCRHSRWTSMGCDAPPSFFCWDMFGFTVFQCLILFSLFSVLQGSVSEYCFHNCKSSPVIVVPGKGISTSSRGSALEEKYQLTSSLIFSFSLNSSRCRWGISCVVIQFPGGLEV